MIPRFRAWDKWKKKMFKVKAIDFIEKIITTDDVLATDNLDTIHRMFSPNEAILMQSTGLKDKNGKEIFDGDIIVDYHTCMRSCFTKMVLIQDSKCLPEWRLEEIREMTDKEIKKYGDGWRDWIIIGNIHENPELLKRVNRKE